MRTSSSGTYAGFPGKALLERLATAPNVSLRMSAIQRAEVSFTCGRRRRPEFANWTSSCKPHLSPRKSSTPDESLYRRWYRTHGVGVNDALLAATVMLEAGKLVTQNVRHFPMPEIEVEQGWE